MLLQNYDPKMIWDAFTKPDACGQGLSACWKEVAIQVAGALKDSDSSNYLRNAHTLRPLAMNMAHRLWEQTNRDQNRLEITLQHTHGYILAQHVASVDPRHVCDHALKRGLKDSFDSDVISPAQAFVLALLENKPEVRPVVTRAILRTLHEPWWQLWASSEQQTMKVKEVLEFLPRFAGVCPDQIDHRLMKTVDSHRGDQGDAAYTIHLNLCDGINTRGPANTAYDALLKAQQNYAAGRANTLRAG